MGDLFVTLGNEEVRTEGLELGGVATPKRCESGLRINCEPMKVEGAVPHPHPPTPSQMGMRVHSIPGDQQPHGNV